MKTPLFSLLSPPSLQKGLILASTLSLLSILLSLPGIVGAQPGGSPPGGNVDAKFNTVSITDSTNDNLFVSADGKISNPSGAVQIDDSNGLFVNGTPGIGPALTVTGNGAHNAKMHSDGWLTGSGGFHLGGDGTYGNSRFVIWPSGSITDNDGAVTVFDGDGLDVRGEVTNKGGQLRINDDVEGILLDSDTSINNDLTVYNDITAWDTVHANKADISWHAQIRRIGNYRWSKILYKTMPPFAATNFNYNLGSNILECPANSIAVACNFSVYNGTAGCGNGSPSGGLNKNAAYETYSMMDPLWNHTTGTGGVCAKTLYNKTGASLCGRVEVVCWDPDGNY